MLIVLLSGCATNPSKETATSTPAAESALNAMMRTNYEISINQAQSKTTESSNSRP